MTGFYEERTTAAALVQRLGFKVLDQIYLCYVNWIDSLFAVSFICFVELL